MDKERDFHNEGQTDAANGEDNRPYSSVAIAVAQYTDSAWSKEMEKANEDYRSGHDHVSYHQSRDR